MRVIAFIAVLVAFSVAGCQQSTDTKSGQQAPLRKPVNRSVIDGPLHQSATENDVITMLGKPDKTVSSNGTPTWYYYRATVDDTNGKVDDELILVFGAGTPLVVTSIVYR